MKRCRARRRPRPRHYRRVRPRGVSVDWRARAAACHIVEGWLGESAARAAAPAAGRSRWLRARCAGSARAVPRGPPTERRRRRAQTGSRRPGPALEKKETLDLTPQEGQRGIRRHLHAHVRRVGGGPLVVERGHLGLNQRHVPPLFIVSDVLDAQRARPCRVLRGTAGGALESRRSSAPHRHLTLRVKLRERRQKRPAALGTHRFREARGFNGFERRPAARPPLVGSRGSALRAIVAAERDVAPPSPRGPRCVGAEHPGRRCPRV